MATMLYKHPGMHEIHGGRFDYLIVEDAEVEDAIRAGWSLTTTEAFNHDQPEPEQEDDDVPPTRDEMLLRAEEIGLEVDGRWSDATLLKHINEHPQ